MMNIRIRKNQTTKKEGNQEANLRENINSKREDQSVKPQQQDQSKRLRLHRTFNSSNVFPVSSKERRFHSNQTIHIKQLRIKFQISKV